MFEKKKYFYEIYREKSFSKAAQKLFISQPALSAIIAKEEQKIGRPIFDRSTSPISLTPLGEQYIECCEKLFLIEDNFTKYLSDAEALQNGQLRIGSNHLFIANVLSDIVASFSTKYPGIRLDLIDLDSGDLKSELMDGNLDLVIDNNELDDKAFDSKLLGTETLLLAVPKSFPINKRFQDIRLTSNDIIANAHLEAGQQAVDMSEFDSVPFILMGRGYDTRNRTNEIFSSFNINPPIRLEMNQLAAVYSITASGAGASLISDTLIKKSPSTSQTMYYYKIDHPSTSRGVYIQTKKNKYETKAAREFISVIKASHTFSKVD